MQTNRLIFRKVTAIAICLAVLTMFVSCEKKIEEIDKKIAIVKAEMGNFEIISSVKYENNVLELDELSFPTTITDNYLTQVVERAGVVVSDTQAKMGEVWVTAYNSAGERIGSFSKFSNDSYPLNLELRWYVYYIYADRSFTRKGKSTEIGQPEFAAEIDCSFEKGWNVMYYILTERKFTTQKPSGKNFVWYYEEFGID